MGTGVSDELNGGRFLVAPVHLALELQAKLNELAPTARAHPEGIRLLGVGQARLMAALAHLERRTQREVLNMQPRLTFDPEDLAWDLHDRSAARGVTLTLIVPPRTLTFHPLLTSLGPEVLFGPVTMQGILIDQSVAVLPGLTTADGDPLAWLATGGEFLDDARNLINTTIAESVPARAPGVERPLNRRQFEVARMVCLGRTDAAIARQLGISERTVARDIVVVLTVTGAKSRGEAILNMLGRGRHSRD